MPNFKKCHNESIFLICRDEKINGLNYKILPKETNIYKTFYGFITKESFEAQIGDDNIPLWFSNKNFTFQLASQQ